ncbi:MAG: HutD family protein [Pseudomonadota bacterium]
MRRWNAKDCPAMPWKNGGGITTELAIAPEGATLDNFDWRFSSAVVSSSGPFSHFAGIDRSLALLQGQALDLQVDSVSSLELTPASAIFRFRGEQQVYATLAQATVVDLNVMTRRNRYSHQLLRLSGSTSHEIQRQATLVLLYCLRGEGCIEIDDALVRMQPGDLLMLERQDKLDRLQLQCGAQDIFYVVHLAEIGKEHGGN